MGERGSWESVELQRPLRLEMGESMPSSEKQEEVKTSILKLTSPAAHSPSLASHLGSLSLSFPILDTEPRKSPS